MTKIPDANPADASGGPNLFTLNGQGLFVTLALSGTAANTLGGGLTGVLQGTLALAKNAAVGAVVGPSR